MRPLTLAIYALLLSAANGSSSPTPPSPTSKSILNRLANGFSERQTALRSIRSDETFMNGTETDENGENEQDEGVRGFFRKRMAESKSETATEKRRKGRDKEDVTASTDNGDDSATTKETSFEQKSDKKRSAGFFNMRFNEDEPLELEESLEKDKESIKSDAGDNADSKAMEAERAPFWRRKFFKKVQEYEDKITKDCDQEDPIIKNEDGQESAASGIIEETDTGGGELSSYEEVAVDDTSDIGLRVDGKDHVVPEIDKEDNPSSSLADTDDKDIDTSDKGEDDDETNADRKDDPELSRKHSRLGIFGMFNRSSDKKPDIVTEPQNTTLSNILDDQESGISDLSANSNIDNSASDTSTDSRAATTVGEGNKEFILRKLEQTVVRSVEEAEIDSIHVQDPKHVEVKDSQRDDNSEDEETQSAKISDECSGKEEGSAPTEGDELEGKDDVVCDISTKEAKNTTSVFRQSLENALPWLEKKNEGKQEKGGQQQNTSDEDASDEDSKSQTPRDEGAMSPNQQNSQEVIPFGGPSAPFIFLSPPPLSRNPHSLGAPRGTPPPSSSANLSGLLHALLPLISKFLLLTLLSSGSALFGFGEGQVYSPEPSQHFMLERINDRYEKDGLAMKKALENPPEQLSKLSWKFANNQRKSAFKKNIAKGEKDSEFATPLRPSDRYSRTVIILDVVTHDRDMSTVVQQLRDSVSFILSQYHDTKLRLEMGDSLEVVVRIESPGGVVQDFGLGADQLSRLKEAGSIKNDLTLTVCVDKIAASGGYMMACQASEGQLLAAPFSVVGSIGVLMETINIHDVLEKYGVKPLLLKAGDAKVPLTQTNKVTDESIAIVQKNLEKVHDAFRKMVAKSRGKVIAENFNNVTNGDIFLGQEALTNGLVDRLMTSDEYVAERLGAGDRVLRLHKYDRSKSGFRLSPLDLLLLRSNGLLGQNLSSKLRQIVKVGQQMMRLGTTMGMIKVLDTSINFLKTSRHEPENGI